MIGNSVYCPVCRRDTGHIADGTSGRWWCEECWRIEPYTGLPVVVRAPWLIVAAGAGAAIALTVVALVRTLHP